MKKETGRGIRYAFVRRLKTTIRGYMLRGLLVLIPLAVTVYVLMLCYRLTAGLLVPSLRRYTGEMQEYVVVLLSIVLFLSLLYLIGLGAGMVIGRRMLALGEGILRRIPLVKTIYGASRQAVDVISKQNSGPSYQAPILAPFPSPSIKTICFVTGKLEIEGEGEFYRVFVPTTPNPTSGFFELYPTDMVEHTNLSMEMAAKSIMSVGMLVPETLGLGEETAAVRALPQGAVPREKRKAFRRYSWRRAILIGIRKRLIAGLLVLVPIAITFFIVSFIYQLTAGRIEPIATILAGKLPRYVIAAISVGLLLIFLYVTGYLATIFLGARLIRLMEGIIGRLPFITTVYGATKQIMQTLIDPNSGPKFQAPVFVSFPFPGAYSIGFYVGTVRGSTGQTLVKVFVPTTPNVSIGLLQFFEVEHVFACDLSLEDAIKMAVSGGIVGPDHLRLLPATILWEKSEEPMEAVLD